MTTKELYDKAKASLKAAQDILAQETVSEDDEKRADALMDECQEYQKKAQRLERKDDLAAKFARPPFDFGEGDEEPGAAPDGAVKSGDVDAALKSIYAGNIPQLEPEEHKAVHVKAFKNWLHTGRRVPSAAIPTAYKAAMQEGTATEGLELVPEEWSSELVTAISAAGVILPLSRVVRMTREQMHVATLTASAAAVLVAEEGSYDEKEPTTADIDVVAYKYTRLSKASDELVADNQFDLWGQILSPDFSNAFSLAMDAGGTTGTGSTQPQGVVVGSTKGVDAASASAITADELIDLYHSLGYQYRARPKTSFMAHDSTIKAVRKLKDSDNQYLWRPGLEAGQPDRLLGNRLVTNNNMATIAASAKTVLFGDFSYFWIFLREGITMKRLEELYSETGQIGFRAYQRWDSHVMLATAFYHILHPTA